MPYRICPQCSGYVSVRRVGRRFRVRCVECGLTYETAPGEVGDPVAAYLRFVDMAERGGGGKAAPARRVRRGGRRSGRAVAEEKLSFVELARRLKEAGVEDPKSLPSAVKGFLADPGVRLVRYRRFPETSPPMGCLVEDAPISEGMKKALRRFGVKRLFRFQEEAFRAILAGKDVVISAPTATGKTEAFAVPVLEQVAARVGGWGPLRPAGARQVQALFIYPTKALARDQAGKLEVLAEGVGLRVAVLDGDTPQEERERIYRMPPDILITNPDMLHLHLSLPRSPMRRLVQGVHHVVLDELHVYVGAFGANVHFLLRRLQRLCPPIQLIGASATVSNAGEFAQLLFGRPVTTVTCDTGKKGVIHFLMLYPEEGSHNTMMAKVARELVRHRLKTLVFANTHRNAEVVNLIARRVGLKSAVHRAGLPPKLRRQIEEDFRSGRLALLVSTPTLELGIDIGDLDGVVSMLVGITRLTQRIGRAGRKGQESVAVLALRSNDPISSYYKEHPDDYFTDIDPAYVEPSNEVVAHHQLLAAALDRPLNQGEFTEFRNLIDGLVEEGLLQRSGRRLAPNPAQARRVLSNYSIRGIGQTVEIFHRGTKIGERQMPMAMSELHPGAIYLHAGETYRSLDFEFRHGVGRAAVERLPPGNRKMTQALREVHPQVLAVKETRRVHGVTAHYADLRITEVVHGYLVKDIYTDRTLEVRSLDQPLSYTYPAKGFFFRAPPPSQAVASYLPTMKESPQGLGRKAGKEATGEGEDLEVEELLMGAFHALEHVLIESSDMFTGGGSQGMGGVSMGNSGVIFVYDGSPGGTGLSLLLYRRLEEAFRRAKIVLESCPCKGLDGCPACTYSYRCGNNNSPLFKAGALESTTKILEGQKTSVDADTAVSQPPIV